MLLLSQRHNQYLNMSQHCLNGKDNLYHLEITSVGFRGLTFFRLQIRGRGTKKKTPKRTYFIYSCALSLDGSRNMAALM